MLRPHQLFSTISLFLLPGCFGCCHKPEPTPEGLSFQPMKLCKDTTRTLDRLATAFTGLPVADIQLIFGPPTTQNEVYTWNIDAGLLYNALYETTSFRAYTNQIATFQMAVAAQTRASIQASTVLTSIVEVTRGDAVVGIIPGDSSFSATLSSETLLVTRTVIITPNVVLGETCWQSESRPKRQEAVTDLYVACKVDAYSCTTGEWRGKLSPETLLTRMQVYETDYDYLMAVAGDVCFLIKESDLCLGE